MMLGAQIGRRRARPARGRADARADQTSRNAAAAELILSPSCAAGHPLAFEAPRLEFRGIGGRTDAVPVSHELPPIRQPFTGASSLVTLTL